MANATEPATGPPPAAEPPPPPPPSPNLTTAKVFVVHYAPDVVTDPISFKITAKPKALAKPFGPTVIEPFIKALNGKRTGGEAEKTLDDFEKVLVGPGTRRSDWVRDLSCSVASVVPDDLGDSETGEIRVDLMIAKDRDVKLVCTNAGANGIQLESKVSARFTKLPIDGAVLPLFLQRINEMCEGANLALSDVKSVRNELAEDGPLVDVGRPCFEILQRAGTTKLEVLLNDEGATRLASVMPEPPEPPEPAHIFRVRCEKVELQMTLEARHLDKTLREGVVVPFLKAYNKKATPKAKVAADDVARLEVDGLAVSDASLASSFAQRGGSKPKGGGAPEVASFTRVEIALAAPADEAAAAGGESAPPSAAGPATQEEQTAAGSGGGSATATGAAPAPKGRLTSHYDKWAKFDDSDDEGDHGRASGGSGGSSGGAPLRLHRRSLELPPR